MRKREEATIRSMLWKAEAELALGRAQLKILECYVEFLRAKLSKTVAAAEQSADQNWGEE